MNRMFDNDDHQITMALIIYHLKSAEDSTQMFRSVKES